jgi:hypothetical protein
MNLLEIFNSELVQQHQTEEDDNTPLKLSDLRKTKLTLTQLHRLRIMNDVRRLEKEQDLERVRKQYKPAEEAAPKM